MRVACAEGVGEVEDQKVRAIFLDDEAELAKLRGGEVDVFRLAHVDETPLGEAVVGCIIAREFAASLEGWGAVRADDGGARCLYALVCRLELVRGDDASHVQALCFLEDGEGENARVSALLGDKEHVVGERGEVVRVLGHGVFSGVCVVEVSIASMIKVLCETHKMTSEKTPGVSFAGPGLVSMSAQQLTLAWERNRNRPGEVDGSEKSESQECLCRLKIVDFAKSQGATIKMNGYQEGFMGRKKKNESEEKKVGACALCDNVSELEKSHIIPEFAYRILQGDDDESPRSLREGKHVNRVFNGHWERLLCRTCESKLSTCEDLGARFFRREGWEKHVENGHVLYYVKLSREDWIRLKLFSMSIFWRAHHSKEGMCKDFRVDEKSLHDFKSHLLNQGEELHIKSDDEYPLTFEVLDIYFQDIDVGFSIQPPRIASSKLSGNVYKINIAGVVMYQHLDGVYDKLNPVARFLSKPGGFYVVQVNNLLSPSRAKKETVAMAELFSKTLKHGERPPDK